MAKLIGDEGIESFGMLSPLLFEVFTGQAKGYFFEKIIEYIISAVGLRNQPAVHIRFTMGTTEHLETVKELPAWLPLSETGASGLLFVQQTHNTGLPWPDSVSPRRHIESSRPDSHPHRPDP